MKKWFLIAMLFLIPAGFAKAEPPAEVMEIEETTITDSDVVSKSETVAVASRLSKCVLAERFYVGGGYNYAFENFRDELNDFDWDNTWGLDFKAGYFFCEYLALEVMFQYLDDFEYKESGLIGYDQYLYSYDYKATISGYNVTLNGKGLIPIDGVVRPYGVLGLGYASGKARERIIIAGVTVTESEGKSDLWGRAGAGLDIFLDRQFALEVEVTYNLGFGDLEDVEYTCLALNALTLF